jgi:hypothetical protein
MNVKHLIAIVIAMSVVTLATVSATPVMGKFCNPSGCKGTEGYYTKEGHHHCWRGTPNCINTKSSGYSG